jgi:hypothetical protein
MLAASAEMRLQRCLMPEPLERGFTDANRNTVDRRKIGARAYADFLQALCLHTPHAGDEAQMISCVPLLLTVVAVTAGSAVGDGIG